MNAFSVDIEDWYHICGIAEYCDPQLWGTFESRIAKNTDTILSLLRQYNIRATFFILGYIASNEPGLIREIKNEGHELASHGYYHKRIYELTEQEFEEDLRKSIDVISSVSGERVVGFRAPEWSIRPYTLWVLRSLRRNGILYDSSMVPLTRMGSREFPTVPTKFETEHGAIWEFPLTTTRLFWENLPFTGGLSFRITPYFYLLSKIKKLNDQGWPAVVCVHPREFDEASPKIKLPISKQFIYSFNVKSVPSKINGLLRYRRFAPVRDVLGLTG